jgi:nucleotide-binding universal stress UspA family protein
MYRKILVANDGSPGALKALAGAIETAKRDGATYRMIPIDAGAFAVEVGIPESYPGKEPIRHRSRR